MYTPVEENYLKTLYALANDAGEVNINDLSKRLNIKMPSVNSMIKKFAEKDLVLYESYKPVKLTKKGKKDAALIIRKHRLTEMFLMEKMGFGWEEVHDIAEQIEHIKSEAFFNKMDEMLGYPKTDPHGSPIPDAKGNMDEPAYRKLSNCRPGETVTFMAVNHSSEEFLKFLNNRNLSLGTVITINAIEEYDNSMKVSYGKKKEELLSHKVCDNLMVK